MAEKIEITKQLVKKLLVELLDQKVEFTVEEDKKDDVIKIKIKTSEPGVLIGFHGGTLSSLQLILGLMVFKKLGEWQRVIVDVNDYRKEQVERLKQIALSAAQKAKLSGQPVALFPMTPFERRIVHLALGELDDVKTKSEGVGNQRYVVIQPILKKIEKKKD